MLADRKEITTFVTKGNVPIEICKGLLICEGFCTLITSDS